MNIMRNTIVIGMICNGLCAVDLTESPLTFEVNIAPQRHEKSTLGLMLVGVPSPAMQHCAAIIKKDLEFSGQFAVDLKEHYYEPKTTTDITALAHQYPLVIFLHEQGDAIDWHMYETG